MESTLHMKEALSAGNHFSGRPSDFNNDDKKRRSVLPLTFYKYGHIDYAFVPW